MRGPDLLDDCDAIDLRSVDFMEGGFFAFGSAKIVKMSHFGAHSSTT